MQQQSAWSAKRQSDLRMRRMVEGVCVLGLAVLFAWAQPALVQAQDEPTPIPANGDVVTPTVANEPSELVAGQIIVGLRSSPENVAARAALAGLNAEFVAAVDPCVDGTEVDASGLRIQVWRVAPGSEADALAVLRQQPDVAFAEQDGVVRAAQDGAPDAVPAIAGGGAANSVQAVYAIDDPLYPDRQWGPQRINLSRALQVVANSGITPTTVRVAVIDSGVDFAHPDLVDRLLSGKNYVTATLPPIDDYGHGTHVTGIIAAITNNGLGIAGSAQSVKIDPRKVLNEKGTGDISNLRTAICEAARDGARVINISLEIDPAIMKPDSTYYRLVKEAVDYAVGKGAMLVAAAGNTGLAPRDGTVWYPARFPGVVAVAALTVNNTRPSYSAQGVELALATPGGDATDPILSLWPSAEEVRKKCAGTGRYLLQSGDAWYCAEYGTSMASPYAAGVAALVWSLQPGMTASQVKALLQQSARSVGLPATVAGAGLVDAEAAVRRLVRSDILPSAAIVGRTVNLGAAPFTTTVVIANPSSDPLTVNGTLAGAGDWFTVTGAVGAAFTVDIQYGAPAYASVAISPTNLVTGTYSGAIGLTATRTDGTPLAKSVGVFAALGDFVHQLWLGPVLKNAQMASEPDTTPFTWEISITPVVTYTLGSGAIVEIDLPFAFPLPGPSASSVPSYTRAVIYADGFVAFPGADAAVVLTPSLNYCLPVFGMPKQAVFGWWADLDPSVAGGEVSTFVPGSDRFVVEFDNVSSAVGVEPAYRVSFQVVLFRNGDVQLNYRDTPLLTVTALQGALPLVTAGVQARAGLYHRQVACRDAVNALGVLPQSGQSIRINRGDIY